uniref:Uncharacterized protein n=1 Tax=Schistocephalus solidus TaxID=70667 RepID=A0A0X3PBL1_SCHSO
MPLGLVTICGYSKWRAFEFEPSFFSPPITCEFSYVYMGWPILSLDTAIYHSLFTLTTIRRLFENDAYIILEKIWRNYVTHSRTTAHDVYICSFRLLYIFCFLSVFFFTYPFYPQ